MSIKCILVIYAQHSKAIARQLERGRLTYFRVETKSVLYPEIPLDWQLRV